jgi:hypothetical protein
MHSSKIKDKKMEEFTQITGCMVQVTAFKNVTSQKDGVNNKIKLIARF